MTAQVASAEARVAVLADCDNTTPDILEYVLSIVAQFGRVVLTHLNKSAVRHLCLAFDPHSITLAAVDCAMYAEIVRRWRAHEHDEWRGAPWAAHSVRAMHRRVRDWTSSALPEIQFYELDFLDKKFIPIALGRDELARAV